MAELTSTSGHTQLKGTGLLKVPSSLSATLATNTISLLDPDIRSSKNKGLVEERLDNVQHPHTNGDIGPCTCCVNVPFDRASSARLENITSTWCCRKESSRCISHNGDSEARENREEHGYVSKYLFVGSKMMEVVFLS